MAWAKFGNWAHLVNSSIMKLFRREYQSRMHNVFGNIISYAYYQYVLHANDDIVVMATRVLKHVYWSGVRFFFSPRCIQAPKIVLWSLEIFEVAIVLPFNMSQSTISGLVIGLQTWACDNRVVWELPDRWIIWTAVCPKQRSYFVDKRRTYWSREREEVMSIASHDCSVHQWVCIV